MSRSTGRHAAPRPTARRTPTRRHSTATKLVASVALVAGSASVAGLGTFGAFTDTTTANQAVASGTVKIGADAASMNVPAAGLVPGDTVQRAITLTRGGGETFGSVKLTTTASAQNKLVTDPANGLQLTIEQCPTAWTASGNTWSCSATPTPVIAKRAVIGTGLDLVAPVASLNSRQQSFLRITLTLPTEANNDFQGLSNALTFTFDALQRAGQPK